VNDAGKQRVGAAGGSSGIPPIDPSENVKALTDAAVRRLDDMAALREKLTNAQIKSLKSEMDWQDKIANLREKHNKAMRHNEADRVDKIRSVDVANAAATAAQLLSAVNTLATTAQTTAEVLRNQVAATATAVANQTERALNPINDRIALLEKAVNQNAGRSGMADPMITGLSEDMKAVVQALAKGTGKSEGFSTSWAILVAVILMLIGYAALKPAAVPQPIFLPAPTATK